MEQSDALDLWCRYIQLTSVSTTCLSFSENFRSCGNRVSQFVRDCRVASDGRAGSSWLARAIPGRIPWLFCFHGFAGVFNEQILLSDLRFRMFSFAFSQTGLAPETVCSSSDTNHFWDLRCPIAAATKCPTFLKFTTLWEEPLPALIFWGTSALLLQAVGCLYLFIVSFVSPAAVQMMLGIQVLAQD